MSAGMPTTRFHTHTQSRNPWALLVFTNLCPLRACSIVIKTNFFTT